MHLFLSFLHHTFIVLYMGQIFDSTVVQETEETIAIVNTVENEPMQVATDDATTAAMNGYTVFIPNFTEPCTLISSTGDRYNNTIQQGLLKDAAVIQQKVDIEQQSTSNNFFRNAKWWVGSIIS